MTTRPAPAPARTRPAAERGRAVDGPTLARERALAAALRAGDERVFAALVAEHTPMMLRVARGYVASPEAAEEVVQEAWIALLKGVGSFEHRASLRTWLFKVLVNIAKTRGAHDHRRATLALDTDGEAGPAVDPGRFRGGDDPWPGHWRPGQAPAPWPPTPEGSVLAAEVRATALRELDRLPRAQRLVVTLRDVLGYGADEVCELLELTPANQRVLLHRGRARVRQALEDYLGGRP